MVLALELDVVEVFEVDTLELVVADGQHLVKRESVVGAVLVVARQRDDVVIGEPVPEQQAPHQATELVERHAHRLQLVEVERRVLRLQRRLDARHDLVDVRLRKLQPRINNGSTPAHTVARQSKNVSVDGRCSFLQ